MRVVIRFVCAKEEECGGHLLSFVRGVWKNVIPAVEFGDLMPAIHYARI